MDKNRKTKKFKPLGIFFLTLSAALLLITTPGVELKASEVTIDLAGTVFEKVGKEAEIDPYLLYAISLCESAYHPNPQKGMVAPYPWVLRTKNKPIYGATQAEAAEELRILLSKSDRSVDIGLMQINLAWHGHRVKDPVDLLDPERNVQVGAAILNELFSRNPDDALKAIGLYHSRSPERSRAYSQTVWRVYTQIRP